MTEQCPICGETKMPGWDQCPACGHPYPVDENDEDDENDTEDSEGDNPVLPANITTGD